jgi:hypothetical protein
VVNPGQGYSALAIASHLRPSMLALVGRDLLALRQTHANLVAAGFGGRVELHHQPGDVAIPGPPAGLIAGVVDEDEGTTAVAATVAAAGDALAPGGRLLLAGSSTAITRIEKHVRARRTLVVEERTRRRGASLLVLRR